MQVLEAEESAEAQAALVVGFCKLLLAGIVTEPKVKIKTLFVALFLKLLLCRF